MTDINSYREQVTQFLQSEGSLTDTSVREATHRLDDFYWDRANDIVREAIEKNYEVLEFTPEEVRFLDFGYIHPKLYGDDAKQLEKTLVTEHGEAPVPNHFYFSDWLAARLFDYVSEARAEDDGNEDQYTQMLVDFESYKILDSKRVEVYQSLGPFIRQVKVAVPKLGMSLGSGLLSRTIDMLTCRQFLEERDDPSTELERLLNFRDHVLDAVKANGTQRIRSVVDDMHRLEAMAWSNLRTNYELTIRPLKAVQDKTSPDSIASITLDRQDFLSAEIKLIKTLLPLGATGERTGEVFSPLEAGSERLHMSDLYLANKILHEADPRFPGNPRVMIAPFSGKGFYQFDRDTMMLPLQPDGSALEVYAEAAARFRVYHDMTHNESRLLKGLNVERQMTHNADSFTERYSLWVNGCGQGQREVFDRNSYLYFKNTIGPDLMSGELGIEHLPKDIKEGNARISEIRKRIKAEEAAPEDYRDLGFINWQRRQYREALEALELVDGDLLHEPRVILGQAFLAERLNREDTATRYQRVIENFPDSIWRLYAEDQMERLKRK